jgi:HTH-type transcriptional regulator / antitoxin HigA
MIALKKYELKQHALPVITSDEQLDEYTNALIELEERRDLTAEDRKYARVLAALIEKYENEHYPIAAATPQEVLVELIEQNGLRQRDLVPLLGTESVVSEIVNGKRALSKTNIERLSQRFRVSPAVFFPQIAAKARRQNRVA